jgi:hypothetical protein
LICLKRQLQNSETIEYLNEITIQQKIFKKTNICLKTKNKKQMALRLAIKESEISDYKQFNGESGSHYLDSIL